MKSILIIIVFSFLLCSCCTLKDCDQEFHPEIHIRFDGFSLADLSKITVLVLDTNSLKAFDSISYSNDLNELTIYHWFLENKKIEIKNYSYLIRTNASVDTINHIEYEKHSETIKCNICFPVGDGSATVITYSKFSFQHNRTKYMDNDTLIIKK